MSGQITQALAALESNDLRMASCVWRVSSLVLMAALLSPGIARSQVSPGETPVDLGAALTNFRAACLDTLPDFSNTASLLASEGFIPSPATGTLFSQKLDLSVKVEPGRAGGFCSMVFVSMDSPEVLGFGLASEAVAKAGGNREIQIDPQTGAAFVDMGEGVQMAFEPSGEVDGEPYYHVVVSSGN